MSDVGGQQLERFPKVVSKGGANLPVCRDDPQVVTHLFGNDFWKRFKESMRGGGWRKRAEEYSGS